MSIRKKLLLFYLGFIVAGGLFGAAFLKPQTSVALVSYPPAALLQPGDITGTMIRNYTITNVNISSSSAIDPTKIATTTTNDFASDVTSTIQGTKTFDTLPIFPTSTPTAQGHAITLNYLNANTITTATTSVTYRGAYAVTASSTSFTSTGTATFVVPANVVSLSITMIGAAKTASSSVATGTLAVTPGTTYYLTIGAQGNNAGKGGYPNGGNTSSSASGGDGSTLFSASSTTTTSTQWIMLVGGAGGRGQDVTAATSGPAGYPNGFQGTTSTNCSAGLGGTQTAGGAAVTPGGGAGSFYQGGNVTSNNANRQGGGGGGGFYGGSGSGDPSGDPGCSGGGGSNFFINSLVSTSTAYSSVGNDGSIILSYNIQNLATIVGNKYGGTIALTASTATGTVVFDTNFTSNPGCTTQPDQNAYAWGKTTTSTFAFNFSTPITSTGTLNYTCL